MSRNPEVHMGVLHYCTFGLEAGDDAQNVRVYTARRKKITTCKIHQNDNMISQRM